MEVLKLEIAACISLEIVNENDPNFGKEEVTPLYLLGIAQFDGPNHQTKYNLAGKKVFWTVYERKNNFQAEALVDCDTFDLAFKHVMDKARTLPDAVVFTDRFPEEVLAVLTRHNYDIKYKATDSEAGFQNMP